MLVFVNKRNLYLVFYILLCQIYFTFCKIYLTQAKVFDRIKTELLKGDVNGGQKAKI